MPPGANLEARARDARYAALEEVRARTGAPALLVGHTADDQAETVLLNFLRGSGSDGLAGMAPVRGTVRRPLLALRRADTHEICARLGVGPVDDAMNADLGYRRVWLRREVMPRLEAGASRDLVPVLARQADVLREEAAFLDAASTGAELADGSLDVPSLVALPRVLARRAVRRWLGAPPANARDVDAVLAVAAGDARAAQLVAGVRVERAGGRLVRARVEEPPSAVVIEFPGRTIGGCLELETWVENGPPAAWPDGRDVCVVDADIVGPDGVLRAAVAGERFHPLGSSGTKTVFDALRECGVPASERSNALVVATGANGSIENSLLPAGSPWWVLGYRIDHRVRVTSRTRRYLWLATGTV